MSFLGPPYTHDIFISYSHGTDGTGEESFFKQWSRCFWKTLEKNLASYQKLRGFNLFFDESPGGRGKGIDPTINLDQQLETYVRGSAIFVALLSYRYFGSTWCQRELETWLDEQKKQGRLTSSRLVPIQIWGEPPESIWGKTLTDANDWPTALARTDFTGLLGFDFYSQAAMLQGKPQPYGWPAPDSRTDNKNFHELVPDVAARLSINLEEIKKGLVAVTSAPKSKSEVYLSGWQADRKVWDGAQRKLSKAGVIVYPETPANFEADNATRMKRLDQEIEEISMSDAVMVVAPDDQGAFRREWKFLNDHALNAATAEAENRLRRSVKAVPVAIINSLTDAEQAERRRANVVNARLGWFDFHTKDWVEKARQWLASPP